MPQNAMGTKSLNPIREKRELFGNMLQNQEFDKKEENPLLPPGSSHNLRALTFNTNKQSGNVVGGTGALVTNNNDNDGFDSNAEVSILDEGENLAKNQIY